MIAPPNTPEDTYSIDMPSDEEEYGGRKRTRRTKKSRKSRKIRKTKKSKKSRKSRRVKRQ